MTSRAGRYVIGLVGAGIGTSLSPALHEREADELGLRCVYQIIDLDQLSLGADDVGDLVVQARTLGFRGLNITHPCKQVVVKYLDELAAEAAVLGAVNTVVFTGDRSIGHNTDGFGFAEGFVRGLPEATLRQVVLLGAGGAGAAVARAVLALGAVRLTVVDVQPDRAGTLAAALTGGAGSASSAARVVAGTVAGLPVYLGAADGLINATPIGMTPSTQVPLPPDLLRPDMWVADVVYRPLETPLLRHARRIGCRTLDGGAMAVFQAVEAFRLFTGVTPDAERMYRHFAALTGTATGA
jgi:shikimate dehydrogenase